LREPVAHLQRAGAIILSRADDARKTQVLRTFLIQEFPHIPVFACRHRMGPFFSGNPPKKLSLSALREAAVIAFAGIARPDSFFDSLRREEILPVRCVRFPDHHFYSAADRTRLRDLADRARAPFLVTTGKDYVRLDAETRSRTIVAGLTLDWGEDEMSLNAFLESRFPFCLKERL
jgi:tetraacyldisaccharide 4'-kinase